MLIFAVFLSVRYPRKYADEVQAACMEFGTDENLVRGVIFVESKYKPDAVSRSGACGLMQLMPDTAAWLAGRMGEPHLCDDLFDPKNNIRLGVSFLAYLTEKYPLADALAAYNAGEGNLMKWKAEQSETYGFAETRDYVKKVLRTKRIYETLR